MEQVKGALCGRQTSRLMAGGVFRCRTRSTESTSTLPRNGVGNRYFPREKRWKNTKTGEEEWHPTQESIIQKTVADAVSKAKLTKRATGHTFRHAFAS